MEISLNKLLKDMYDSRVSVIRNKNIELEREYFTANREYVPMGEIMNGLSYEDNFLNFKKIARNGNEYDISQIFMLLQEYFLFSKGHDMMFKKKLEADVFTSVPVDNLIYPMLEETVKEKYNDVSVMRENPNLESNIKGIDELVYTYTELSSLLYLLYCNDFQFPKGWEEFCSDTHEELISVLNKSNMKIGGFLHALIDFKCAIMSDIFSEIENSKIKNDYLKKVEKLQKAKHEETDTFPYAKLSITYFLDHTFLDFFNGNFTEDSVFVEDDDKQLHKEKLY